jgi:hypothetical protein
MAERLYYFARLCSLAFWMGGFMFYALVVIPVGNRVLGGSEQGLVTQQVSGWMNWIGVVALAILLPGAWRGRWMTASWLVMAVTLAGLFWLHPRLDRFIEVSDKAVSDHRGFYQWHRAYLIVITIQWCAALVHSWCLTAGGNSPSGPQPYDMRKKNMAC